MALVTQTPGASSAAGKDSFMSPDASGVANLLSTVYELIDIIFSRLESHFESDDWSRGPVVLAEDGGG